MVQADHAAGRPVGGLPAHCTPRRRGQAVLDEELGSGNARRAEPTGLPERRSLAYDAVLVDEGQDFRPSWWTALRAALRDKGEMMLVADRAQDIYERGAFWTEDVMQGAGFSGPWNELRISHRMPPALTRLVADFRRSGSNPVVRASPQSPHLKSSCLSLAFAGGKSPAGTEPDAVLRELEVVVEGGAYSDIGVMTGTRASASAVVEALEAKGIRCIHTMSPDHRIERQLKHFFFRGDARVKVTPIQNFKGWEMPRIVVLLDDPTPSVAYTALSRLSIGETGSALSVVCSIDAYAEYGRTWPAFEDGAADAGDVESSEGLCPGGPPLARSSSPQMKGCALP